MAVKKMVAIVECDMCGREELDPPDSWLSFQIELSNLRFIKPVSLCDVCYDTPVDQLLARLNKEAAPCRI